MKIARYPLFQKWGEERGTGREEERRFLLVAGSISKGEMNQIFHQGDEEGLTERYSVEQTCQMKRYNQPVDIACTEEH